MRQVKGCHVVDFFFLSRSLLYIRRFLLPLGMVWLIFKSLVSKLKLTGVRLFICWFGTESLKLTSMDVDLFIFRLRLGVAPSIILTTSKFLLVFLEKSEG